jgi:hypothetical protein
MPGGVEAGGEKPPAIRLDCLFVVLGANHSAAIYANPLIEIRQHINRNQRYKNYKYRRSHPKFYGRDVPPCFPTASAVQAGIVFFEIVFWRATFTTGLRIMNV